MDPWKFWKSRCRNGRRNATQDSYPRAETLPWESRLQSPRLPLTMKTRSHSSRNVVGPHVVHQPNPSAWVNAGGEVHTLECVGAGFIRIELLTDPEGELLPPSRASPSNPKTQSQKSGSRRNTSRPRGTRLRPHPTRSIFHHTYGGQSFHTIRRCLLQLDQEIAAVVTDSRVRRAGSVGAELNPHRLLDRREELVGNTPVEEGCSEAFLICHPPLIVSSGENSETFWFLGRIRICSRATMSSTSWDCSYTWGFRTLATMWYRCSFFQFTAQPTVLPVLCFAHIRSGLSIFPVVKNGPSPTFLLSIPFFSSRPVYRLRL